MFTRLAIERFYDCKRKNNINYFNVAKICESVSKAVEKMFDEHLLPYFNTFNTFNEFRKQKMYTEVCDNALRSNLITLREIYKKYAAKDDLAAGLIADNDKTMSVFEFTDLMNAA